MLNEVFVFIQNQYRRWRRLSRIEWIFVVSQFEYHCHKPFVGIENVVTLWAHLMKLITTNSLQIRFNAVHLFDETFPHSFYFDCWFGLVFFLSSAFDVWLTKHVLCSNAVKLEIYKTSTEPKQFNLHQFEVFTFLFWIFHSLCNFNSFNNNKKKLFIGFLQTRANFKRQISTNEMQKTHSDFESSHYGNA